MIVLVVLALVIYIFGWCLGRDSKKIIISRKDLSKTILFELVKNKFIYQETDIKKIRKLATHLSFTLTNEFTKKRN